MSGIHTRLKEVRTHFKLSIREFSKEIYFSHSVYGQVEYGTREPNNRIIQLIVSRFNVNKEWLLNGNGEMFTSSPPDIRLETILGIYKEWLLNGNGEMFTSSPPDIRLETILGIYDTVDDNLKDCLLEQSKIILKIHNYK